MSGAKVGRVLFGYLTACLTVGVGMWALPVLGGIASVLVSGPPYADYSHGTTVVIFLIYALITTVSTVLLTAVPSLILILIAERLNFRAWWGHAIAAAFIGILAYSLVPWTLPWTGGAPLEAHAAAGFAMLGAVAGLVYWFIAVRGRDRHEPLTVEEI